MRLITEDRIAQIRIVSDNRTFMREISDGTLWVNDIIDALRSMGKLAHITITDMDITLHRRDNVELSCVIDALRGKNVDSNGITVSKPKTNMFMPIDDYYGTKLILGIRKVKISGGRVDTANLQYNDNIIATNIGMSSLEFNPPFVIVDVNNSMLRLGNIREDNGGTIRFVVFIARYEELNREIRYKER